MFTTAAALTSLCFGAAAQSYPSKPIRLVVPFAAGGPTDVYARSVGQELSKLLGQPVIVDNRPGAGGNVGADIVAKSAPDGYNIVLGAVGAFAVNMTLYPKMPYDVLRDFAPVSLITVVPMMLVVNPALPVKSPKDLVERAKAKPGQLTYGSAGNGTSVHMSTEMFKAMTGIDMVHVPYKGVAPAMTDLIGGQLQLMFSDATSAIPHVKSGKIRAVAVTKHVEAMPEVPTFAQSGYPSYDPTVWYGVFAPAGTPRDIVLKLNGSIVKALQAHDVRERLISQGAQPTSNTPEEFTEFVRAEIPRWEKVVKASGAKVD
ncbi:MAG: tripartite tricarboxylate transporter substrate binding protein [Betaproteobacteria bacterium]|nr:tripartite tricarboxylate transporter substrate binding protein [Betaproteobacteria bacterium]